MTGLIQDVRYALRQLRKNPGFTAVAVLTLALGIGANTAIFTLLNAIMLKSVPVHDPEHLLVLQWSARTKAMSSYGSFGDCAGDFGGSFSGCSFSFPMFREIRAKANVFSSVAAFAGPAELDLTGNGEASIARGELVSGDYFHTLGVKAALGRTLEPADEASGAEPVVVLSYDYWTRAFGGDGSVLGKTIRLNNITFTVVGVAEPRFTRLTPGKTQDMWLPLTLIQRLGVGWIHDPEDASHWWLSIVARPRPSVSLEQAQAGVSLIFRDELLYGAKPDFKDADQPDIALVPAQQALAGIRTTLAEPLFILMTIVAVVLLIACANVAGLMLARATGREREIAVRFALGAGRERIIRQLLTESVVLSAIGSAMGAVFAFWGAHALAAFLADNWASPLELSLRPDARVLTFTLGMTTLAGIGLGIVPALRGTGVDVLPALKKNEGTGSAISGVFKGRFRLGDSLVVGQVALSVLVLVVASLLLRTLVNLKRIDPGFDTRQVLLFEIDPTLAGYTEAHIRGLYRDLQAQLVAQPGVVSASYSMIALLNGGLHKGYVYIKGQPKIATEIMPVGPGFFETMRIPLLTGRAFAQSDPGSAQPVAIINETFARRFFAGRNPVGLHFGGNAGNKEVEREIVGVVADAKYDQLRKVVEPTVYMPLESGWAYFELRTTSNPAGLVPMVRRVVSGLDKNLPLRDVRTQSEMVDRLLFNERLVAHLSGLLAVFALVLVCVGLYGLLSYEVSRRTREIGIRSALGAHQRDVLILVIGQGISLALVGIAIGVTVTLGVTRYLQSMLYGVRPTDPLAFIATALLLIIVAFLACYLPARRAAKVDPMVALRYE
jgi:predicted permease